MIILFFEGLEEITIFFEHKKRTILRPPNNGGKNTRGGDEAALEVCWFIFRPDDPSLYPVVPTNNAGRTDPLAGASDGAVLEYQAPTKTAAPKSATSTAIRSGNWVSNQSQPTEGEGKDQELSSNQDSDVTLSASSGTNYDDSYYVEMRKNSHARSDNSLKLKANTEEIWQIRNDLNAALEDFPTPRALFTHPH